MGKGMQPLPEGGVRAHEALVERIVSGAAGASREERARAVVEAVAELLEQDAAHAPRVLAELLEDDCAQAHLATALNCATKQLPALLGGAMVALYRDPTSASRRANVAEALSAAA